MSHTSVPHELIFTSTYLINCLLL